MLFIIKKNKCIKYQTNTEFLLTYQRPIHVPISRVCTARALLTPVFNSAVLIARRLTMDLDVNVSKSDGLSFAISLHVYFYACFSY